MFRFLNKRKASSSKEAAGKKAAAEPSAADAGIISKMIGSGRTDTLSSPFAGKDGLNVLIRGQNHSFAAPLLEMIKKDFGVEKKATIASERVHNEIFASKLTLPGYQLLAMPPRRHFSRMRNRKADGWDSDAHASADAFVYSIKVDQAEEYLTNGSRYHGNGWEQDRYTISQLLRQPRVVENPKKPLLLLVNVGEDDEVEAERISNLLGLAGLARPFRAVSFGSGNADGALKEALEWLTNTARCAEDESTAMMGSDTEEEGSVITASTTTSTVNFPSNGVGHYMLDYEPTLLGGNAVLQRFEPVKKGSYCPFARAARLWGGKLPDEHTPKLAHRVVAHEEVAILNAGPLAAFVAKCNDGEALDGFCFEIPGARYSVEGLGQQIRELLIKLAELDPSGENAMKMGPIDQPEWRFRFAGEDFFLTTFSPVYKETSSRYCFGASATFLLFQPMTSFARHGLVKDTPTSATNWDNPTTMRDKARVAHKNNGCPYHIPEELPYPVAEHVVKPLEDDGYSCVRWWEPVESNP